jgi:predicted DNA-binding transcriptional regulator AlpA
MESTLQGPSWDTEEVTIVYLSVQDVAAHLGVSVNTVKGLKLPEPDVRIGSGRTAPRGWSVATIDEWNAQRPGPGRWGPRKS